MNTTRTPTFGRAMLVAAALAVAGCAAPEPVVTKSISIDEKGRKVSHYRICEARGLPGLEETACRTEIVVHNYCYQTLGRVDCYEQPVPGRTAMRFRH